MTYSCHVLWNLNQKAASFGNKLDLCGIVLLMWSASVASVHFAFVCDPGLRLVRWALVSRIVQPHGYIGTLRQSSDNRQCNRLYLLHTPPPLHRSSIPSLPCDDVHLPRRLRARVHCALNLPVRIRGVEQTAGYRVDDAHGCIELSWGGMLCCEVPGAMVPIPLRLLWCQSSAIPRLCAGCWRCTLSSISTCIAGG